MIPNTEKNYIFKQFIKHKISSKIGIKGNEFH